MYELTITSGNNMYFPSVVDGVSWNTEIKGSPGSLKFNVIADGVVDLSRGNAVRFIKDKDKVFYGFIFTVKAGKDKEKTEITCYDQLRYLKNKDTKAYTKKTTSELVKILANEFHLEVGKIVNTRYKMSRIEDNKALFDMIINSMDETLKVEKKLYVLYDDFGKLTLKDVESMKLNLLIDETGAENYNYSASIDSDTYNKIKLAFDNEETGKREVFIAQDSKNINSWGVLQYYEKVNSNDNIKNRVNSLLKLYNQETKTLSISKCFGDVRVRAGASIIVPILGTKGKIEYYYMLVTKATHTFGENEHFMDLTLKGGDIYG